MEIVNELSSLLTNELKEVRQLNDAFMELDSLIIKEAGCIDRLDRIARINTLKARLVSKVDRIQQEERSSEAAFNTGQLFSGVLSFFAGSIIGKILKQESPFVSGGRLFIKELEKKASFGTAIIASKEDSKLEDIEVIAISRLAREAKTTEADIISSLKSQGYSLMTPEELWKSLDQLKLDIKEGGN